MGIGGRIRKGVKLILSTLIPLVRLLASKPILTKKNYHSWEIQGKSSNAIIHGALAYTQYSGNSIFGESIIMHTLCDNKQKCSANTQLFSHKFIIKHQ